MRLHARPRASISKFRCFSFRITLSTTLRDIITPILYSRASPYGKPRSLQIRHRRYRQSCRDITLHYKEKIFRRIPILRFAIRTSCRSMRRLMMGDAYITASFRPTPAKLDRAHEKCQYRHNASSANTAPMPAFRTRIAQNDARINERRQFSCHGLLGLVAWQATLVSGARPTCRRR